MKSLKSLLEDIHACMHMYVCVYIHTHIHVYIIISSRIFIKKSCSCKEKKRYSKVEYISQSSYKVYNEGVRELALCSQEITVKHGCCFYID